MHIEITIQHAYKGDDLSSALNLVKAFEKLQETYLKNITEKQK